MKTAVIVFPGSNCDRDVAVALESVFGIVPSMVWHAETSLPKVDLIVLPGGFSHGDYLRSGAIAAHAPVMRAVKESAARGVAVLGICNGFQILTEAGLLPGVLMRNASLRYICRETKVRVERNDTAFTSGYGEKAEVSLPIAHKDGNYAATDETIARLEGEGQVVWRYAFGDNPNGSRNGIAGLISPGGRIMGLMPHPERAADLKTGRNDGRTLFESLQRSLN